MQYDFQKEVKYVTAPPRVIADTEAQETRKIAVDFAIPRRNPTPPRVPLFPLLLVLSVLRRENVGGAAGGGAAAHIRYSNSSMPLYTAVQLYAYAASPVLYCASAYIYYSVTRR